MKNHLLLIVSLLALLQIKTAKAQFSIDAQIRPRFELRHGYQKLVPENAQPSVFVSQRTRLTFGYKTDNLKIVLSPQDVRVWGDEQMANMTAVYGDSSSFDMFEGYAEARIKKNTWIAFGRQQLVYDNEWLLSARNWNQHGSASDALIIKTKPLNTNLHLGLIWNSAGESLSENLYPSGRLKSLNYLWLNKPVNDKLKISLIHISSGVTRNDSSRVLYYRHTSGVFSELKTTHVSVEFNSYYQYGVNRKGKSVSALLGAADIRYSGESVKSGLSIAYLSGNKTTGSTLQTDHLFDMLYGARHKYFGFMDYFRNFENDTQQGGLIDLGLYFEYSPRNVFTFGNTVHYFQLAQTNDLTGSGKQLGFENDFIVKYKAADWCNLELGYCFFISDNTLKQIQNITNPGFSNFFYLQCTIKSTVFSNLKENTK